MSAADTDDDGSRPADGRTGAITAVHRYELPLARTEVWGLIGEVAIEQVQAPALVRGEVRGDVVGDAVLTLDEVEGDCLATLRRSLAPGNAALQLVSRFAVPMAVFGHDWVLDSGARQFLARAVVPLTDD